MRARRNIVKEVWICTTASNLPSLLMLSCEYPSRSFVILCKLPFGNGWSQICGRCCERKALLRVGVRFGLGATPPEAPPGIGMTVGEPPLARIHIQDLVGVAHLPASQ